MQHREIEELAKNWVAAWSKAEPPSVATGEFGESPLDWDLPREDPELCWEVLRHILAIIEPSPTNHHFQVLAAGPLEDLLANHGDAFIDRVEAEASRNPAFALLLGGVWRNTMSTEVWSRVQACANGGW